jgi:quercetin dioxygenase-like cupin family protein
MKRTIVNPIFKDTVTFIKTSEETNGRSSELEVFLYPQGGTPMHTHSRFIETFTAVDGVLGLRVEGEKILLNPGEKFSVQRGKAHHFFNEGSGPIKFHLEFTPGHTGAENMLRIIYGMAGDGLSNKAGVPKSITAIAVVSEMGDSMLTGVMSILAPLLKILAKIGRRNGLEKKLLARYCK